MENNNSKNSISKISPDGIVLLAKQPGLTSFNSLNNVKKALNTKKVGHTGTLDSFAQGLLVVCTGRYTRLAGNITEFNKSYTAVIKFGEETDTLEYTGRIIKESALPSLKELKSAILKFTGTFFQRPPAFSAIHVNGKRASDAARCGVEIQIPKRQITVFKAELLDYELKDDKVSYAKIFFSVSKGTYIRALARDIAQECNSTGHLAGLLRNTVGNFELKAAAGFGLLKPFTIEQCKKDISEYFEKKSDLVEAKEKSEHKPYVPTAEDKIIKSEIVEKISDFTEETAILCGFINFHIKDEKSYDDFIHGKKLSLKMFTDKIQNSEAASFLSVFYNGKFTGLIEANSSKLNYKFVLN